MRSPTTELLCHLRHLEAFLGTAATRLGTGGHVLVIGHRFASGSTLVAALGTTLCSVRSEITFPSAQGRTHFAAFRAVHAEVHTLGVFLLPVSDESRAVMEATIALHLAIRAHGCTLLQVSSVRAIRRERSPTHSEQSQSNGTE